ncbi:hypothetical protein GGG16DRAFT_115739 [Schizophyllum commune]
MTLTSFKSQPKKLALMSRNRAGRTGATKHPTPLVNLNLLPHASPSVSLVNIQSIPAEILSEIFLLSISKIPTASRDFMPPTIARVCRQWRAVACGYPRLWTTVNIDYRRSTPLDDAPLFVYVSGRDSEDGFYEHENRLIYAQKHAAKVLQRVAALSSHRWRSLTIIGDYLIFARLTAFNAPQLERVVFIPEIYVWRENFDTPKPLPLTFLRKAPLLRAATLNVAHPVMALPFWSTRVNSMTYILPQRRTHEFKTVMRLLATQQQLRTLEVLDPDGRLDMDVELMDIDLGSSTDHLSKLTVSGMGHLFLGNVVAPALEKLSLSDFREAEYEGIGLGPISSLTRMIEQSPLCSLRALELIGIEDYADSAFDRLYHCLQGLSGLDSLRIEDPRDNNWGFVRGALTVWLTRTNTSPLRLPNLTRLSLEYGRTHRDGVEVLVQKLMSSRAASGTANGIPLKALTHFTSNLGPESQIP